mmetsp:Transcript_101414/g.160361  ORF Transcript_101414/g.160361 Transcript_101414/m.160361 type:complete len:197 (+) Transcript_101414:74-664(+)|eukprot:CAMPEP_0169162228 /NCGR_PEP_ID=MMETSP1015-20121227/57529_1 /TAXON_ID=342587 /ORGANISM="Karlodinium micrum, Strain CCMP2283" /LENGTH=196 /DNA_ID=CAMNT_0009234263 /DNA_START=74 /DNA_END=664 /DNA_ORIENTATION=+
MSQWQRYYLVVLYGLMADIHEAVKTGASDATSLFVSSNGNFIASKASTHTKLLGEHVVFKDREFNTLLNQATLPASARPRGVSDDMDESLIASSNLDPSKKIVRSAPTSAPLPSSNTTQNATSDIGANSTVSWMHKHARSAALVFSVALNIGIAVAGLMAYLVSKARQKLFEAPTKASSASSSSSTLQPATSGQQH